MAAKSKSRLVRDDIDDDVLRARVEVYHADANASPPNHARIQITLTSGAIVDRPLSDYSLSPAQKASLNNLANSLWTETIILEGYT